MLLLSYFLNSSAKPSSDLLDLQPDFSSTAQGGAAAPAGASAWGGKSNNVLLFLFRTKLTGYIIYRFVHFEMLIVLDIV